MSGKAAEVRLSICPECGGYDALTTDDYVGALTGDCDICHALKREVHQFGLSVDIGTLGPCECRGGHLRRETCR